MDYLTLALGDAVLEHPAVALLLPEVRRSIAVSSLPELSIGDADVFEEFLVVLLGELAVVLVDHEIRDRLLASDVAVADLVGRIVHGAALAELDEHREV